MALVAMSIFLGTGWSDNGPGLGLSIALTYLVAFVALAEVFRRRGHPSLPDSWAPWRRGWCRR